MYKTKLQEVCHKKKWALPIYSCVKDGPPHNPLFRASVSVNGVSFSSPDISKSSKEAINQAAELAFLHLTSPSDAEPIGEGTTSGETRNCSECHENASGAKTSENDAEKIGEGAAGVEKLNDYELNANASGANTDTQHKYKMQLQNFARSKKLDPPVFYNKREGPPHALRFQATVTINGNSFDSPGWFANLKDAEHAASKVALMSLSPKASQEVDIRLYKNLLQELAQGEGLMISEYNTTKCGPPHQITFFSTVEVEGEIFHGNGEHLKKLAEFSAAKAAYSVLMERKSSRSGGLSPGKEPPQVIPDSVKQSEEQHDKEHKGTTIVPPLSALSITQTKTKNATDTNCYLLCSRFKVYTSLPHIVLPKGTVLLPIDDGKWVPVSLEFANEKIST